MSDQTPAALPIGATFHGRYEVLRCIRAGGMGAVYEVLHLETRRRRALKVMLPSLVADPDLRARFELEATVTADIDSEHIVETFDAGVDGPSGAPFLVMELLKGEDLDALVAARGRLPPDEVVGLLHQAALALDKTHAAGIVHRDLKPENMFVTRRDDGTPRLKILDFGIAKVVATSTQGAKATRSMGTPLFMSPEQVTGDGSIGPRADLYALGQIAYALLVGEGYWQKETQSAEGIYPLLMRIAQGAVEPASVRAARRGVALPPSFDAWFAQATAASPSQRFARASELVTALAAALGAVRPAITSFVDAPSAERASLADSPTIDALSIPGGVVAISSPHQRSEPQSSVPEGRSPDHLAGLPVSAQPAAPRRSPPVAPIAAVLLLLLLGAGAALAALRGPTVTHDPTPIADGSSRAMPPATSSAEAPPSVTIAPDLPATSAAPSPSLPVKAPPPVPPAKTSRPILVPKVPKESRDPTLVR